jgi:hypothetical protein
LQEQERHPIQPFFLPEKSQPSLNYTAQPFVPSHHMPAPAVPAMGMPPQFISSMINPYMQPPPAQRLEANILKSNDLTMLTIVRPKKILSIVDPDTMKEVTPEATTASTTSPSRVQQQPQQSGVFYPPYGYMPGSYNRGIAPGQPFYPNHNVGVPPFLPEIPAQDKSEPKTPPKQEVSPKGQRKFSASSSTTTTPPQAKSTTKPDVYRVKSPGPGTPSTPQTTPTKSEDKLETPVEPATPEKPPVVAVAQPVVETPTPKPAEVRVEEKEKIQGIS